MANSIRSETFENATINLEDMTITEFRWDSVSCYSLQELLKRWDGVSGVTLSIERMAPMQQDGRKQDEPQV